MNFSGSGLLPSTETRADGALRLAIQYLRDGRNTQAFALLSAMEDSENPTAVFALALCYLRAGEFPAAIALEFYLWKIKRGTSV